MATYKKKRKLNWKSIISVVLVVAVVIALGVGIKTFANDDTKTVNKLGLFSVGSVSEETGEHVKCDNALYTNKLLECQGLTITPDFEFEAKYQIFWYNEDELYFGKTEVLNGKFVNNIPDLARYCRIVVFPNPVDENGKEIKDFKIKFYEKQSYVKGLKIEVNKDQSWSPVDYYQEAFLQKAPEGYVPVSIDEIYELYEYMMYHNHEGNTSFVDGMTRYDTNHYVIKLKCDNLSKLKFTVNEKEGPHEIFYVLMRADGTPISIHSVSNVNPGSEHIADLTHNGEDAAYILFNVAEIEKPIVINAYLPR